MARALSAMAIALSCVVAAAVPTLAAIDLWTLLADPPSSDWVEGDASVDVLSGPFTAHDYATFLTHVNGSAGGTEIELGLEGFVGGYAREWEQRGSGDVMIERVFEFKAAQGATSWYHGLKRGAQTASRYKADLATSVIPNSFGVLIVFTNGPQWRVEFVKGNLVFVVHADVYNDEPGSKDDLSALAIGQATTEYENAPAMVDVGASGNALPSWVLASGLALMAGVAILTVTVIAIVALRGRRRARAVINSAPKAMLSPDGRYWWDGTTWRPTGSGP